MPPSFFIFGVTGYIGGAVLLGIRRHFGPDTPVTALVRSENHFDIIEALGIKIVHGSHSDLDLITNHLSQHHYDVVLNCADADDLALTKAILTALKKRKSEGEPTPILVHTSGTGVISDAPTGKWQEIAEKIWDDNKPEDIKSIAPTQPHRKIDLEIFAAASAGEVHAYIIAPSCIYGVAHGNPIHKVSQQVPGMIRLAKKNGKALFVGDGTNRWNNVHILDLVELYLLVIESALSPSRTYKSPVENFYFGSVGEHEWGTIIRQIAKLLHTKGAIQSDELSVGSIKEYPILLYVATNSRSVANRGFTLGWKPKHKVLEDDLEEEVDAALDGLS